MISTSLDCFDCHTSEGWTPQKDPLDFDHDRQTRFPRTGRHAEVRCTGCHLRRQWDQPKAAGAVCATCHVDVHLGALGSDCATCHDTEAFPVPRTTDAHARSAFPLSGAHELIGCESCHEDDRGGQFAPLDTECFSCHETDYNGAEFVDHVAGGYPTECLECHSTIAWRHAPAFDHTSVSNGFELLGAHARTSCGSCHRRPGNELRFEPSDQNDCIACHQTDYERQHGGTGLSTGCAGCHNPSDWEDVDFDHELTGFELLGQHQSLDCESCHTRPGNQLRFPRPGGQDDCIACHQTDYNAEHSGTGFPTTCLTCHGTDQWPGASFDHDAQFFPIYSGTHQGEWNACQDCHTTPGNFQLFSCLTCHEHTQSRADADHSGVPGYVYQSSACLSCHPDGESD
jgi:hypothetical protein